MYPKSLTRLIEVFERFPGIGRKTAERMAFHVLRLSGREAMELAYAVRDLKKKTRPCRRCNNLSDEELCPVCKDPRRDASLLCVVEHPRDLFTLEQLESYRGLYHVLLGNLALLDGVAPSDLPIEALIRRIREPESGIAVAEVILATNPNLDGDATALLLAERLKDTGVRITHLARGMPTGGSIERSNRAILYEALIRRTEM